MSTTATEVRGSTSDLLDRPERVVEQLADIAEQVLRHARAGGASAAEAGVSHRLGRDVSVRLDEIETLEE
ncbi:MAG: hypothetical protein ACPGJE_06705, partial [Wenzhouxiangellaceae bacterium]